MRAISDRGLQPCLRVAGLWLTTLCLSCVSTGPAPEIWLLNETFPSADTVTELASTPSVSGVLAVRTAGGGDTVFGYGVTERVKARSGPFKIFVIVDTELVVRRVAILSYPWERGRDVRSAEFTNQFRGKGPGDPWRLGTDVDAMTGATLSSKAVTEGVRRAVDVVKDIRSQQVTATGS